VKLPREKPKSRSTTRSRPNCATIRSAKS
jgi:hypothetical protein